MNRNLGVFGVKISASLSIRISFGPHVHVRVRGRPVYEETNKWKNL